MAFSFELGGGRVRAACLAQAMVLAVFAAWCGVAHASSLPDGRHYEQVSPVDKAGADVGTSSASGGTRTGLVVSPDGDRVVYVSLSAHPGDQDGWYVSSASTRGADGWLFQGLSDRPGPGADGHPAASNSFFAFDDDRRVGLYADYTHGPHPQLYVRRADGSRVLVAQGSGPVTALSTLEPRGISADGRHVVFASPEKLVPIQGDPDTGGHPLLYEWIDDGGNGTLRLVNLNDDGSLLNPPAYPAFPPGGADLGFGPLTASLGGGYQTALFGMRNAISADGSRIFFQAPRTGPLYVREDGARTIQVSAPQGGLAPATQTGYLGATSDGTKVWFYANAPLTSHAPAGADQALYQYDLEAHKLSWITTLPAGQRFPTGYGLIPADGGDRIYYTVDRNAGLDTFQDVYTWAGGTPTLVFQSSVPGEAISGGAYSGLNDYGTPSGDVSADGRYLTFSVERGTSPDVRAEIYRYDAQTGSLQDITAIPGVPPFTYEPRFSGENDGSVRVNTVHVMSRDGRTVFFDTDAPMVPEDTNGVRDVYEWHDGEIYLISAGTGPDDSLFSGLDATATGVNAFFVTRDKLVPQDGDYLLDIYDARIGGVPPSQRPQPPTCSGDACQGAAGLPPGIPAASSAIFSGPGNVEAESSRHRSRPQVSRRRVIVGAAGTLRVRVAGGGRIMLSGRLIRRAARTVKASGIYRIKVRLTKKAQRMLRLRRLRVARTLRHLRAHNRLTMRARRVLANRERLRATVVVTFVPRGGQKASTRTRLTFKQRQKPTRRRGYAASHDNAGVKGDR